jgi:hypothetical protein
MAMIHRNDRDATAAAGPGWDVEEVSTATL